MYDAFALIDGGGAGVDENDDRKITLDEWISGRGGVTGYAFQALQNAEGLGAEAQFRAMNRGQDGSRDEVVMLNEFCAWVVDNERGTEWGELLHAGD